MNEKIMWFARYLGCRMIHQHPNSPRIIITPHFLDKFSKDISRGRMKLILKELSDITEDDLRRVLLRMNVNAFHGSNPVYNFLDTKRFIMDVFLGLEKIKPRESDDLISALRSEAYAINVPSELYTTQEELNEVI